MPLHYIAWRSALAEWKCDFPEDLFYAWGGFPVAEIISRLNERQGLKIAVAEVALNGSAPSSVTVAVTTGGTSAKLLTPVGPVGTPQTTWWSASGLSGLSLLVIWMAWRRKQPIRLLRGLAFACLFLIASILSSCGGGGNNGAGGTPAGTYNLTVTGTFSF